MRPEISEDGRRDPESSPTGADVPTTAHAAGVLVLALRLPVAAAESALHAVARRYRVPVGDLARAVAMAASGAEVTDRELAAVVNTEWGDLLA